MRKTELGPRESRKRAPPDAGKGILPLEPSEGPALPTSQSRENHFRLLISTTQRKYLCVTFRHKVYVICYSSHKQLTQPWEVKSWDWFKTKKSIWFANPLPQSMYYSQSDGLGGLAISIRGFGPRWEPADRSHRRDHPFTVQLLMRCKHAAQSPWVLPAARGPPHTGKLRHPRLPAQVSQASPQSKAAHSGLSILHCCSKMLLSLTLLFLGLPGWFTDKEPGCNAGDVGLIPGLGGSPGEGNGNPFQCS